MNKNKNGFTIVELMVVVAIIGIFIGILFIPLRNYIFGNKQIIDFNYNYNTAYIKVDDNKFQKYSIKAWKDWDRSDSVQVILKDGTPIYTHLANVKLTKE